MFKKITPILVIISALSFWGEMSQLTSAATNEQTNGQPTSLTTNTTTPVLNLRGASRVYVGQVRRLTGQVVNSSAHPRWSSSNSKVLKVSQMGLVKGVKAGQATITLSYQHVTKRKTIRVTQQTSSDLSRRFKQARWGQTLTLVGNFHMKGDVKLPAAKNVKVNATKASFTGKQGFSFYYAGITG